MSYLDTVSLEIFFTSITSFKISKSIDRDPLYKIKLILFSSFAGSDVIEVCGIIMILHGVGQRFDPILQRAIYILKQKLISAIFLLDLKNKMAPKLALQGFMGILIFYTRRAGTI